MAQGLRRIDPLVFDENIAHNWEKFKREWHVYSNAGLSAASRKVRAYTFLNLAGPEALDKLDTFDFGADEDREDPDILIKKFEELCLPVKNVIMDRHAFNTTNQTQHESIQSYVSTLKILAKKCEFGSLHDELIRDRLVCGIHSDTVRAQLLKEKKLTLHSAVEICMLHEQSEKSNRELKKEAEVCTVQFNPCTNCGGQHTPDRNRCPAFNKRCNTCGKMNHFSKCCRSGRPSVSNRPGQVPPPTVRRGRYTHVSELDTQPTWESTDVFHCETVEMFYCESIDKPGDVHVQDERFAELSTCNTGKQLTIKIDTGAKCNVISRTLLQHIDPTARINLSKRANLVAYGGHIIQTLGAADVNFSCGLLRFQVVDRDVKPLLGLRDCVRLGYVTFGPEVHAVVQQEAPELTEHRDLFDTSTIGKLPVVYHMRLDDTVRPTICAPRRVPLAMKDKIVAELHRMTELGVITPVHEPTEWVSAMVAASKRDGSMRLCIDPVNLNKALLRPHHPMKTVEEVIADMPDAKMFSILDAKCGFWQVPLSKESSRLTTFMTPVGRYAFLRMPYGITTGSEVFQRCMEQLFEGQPCAIVIDDILVWGRSRQEHDLRLRQVLNRIRAVNLRLNPEKCRFRVTEVSYVGHLLTNQGVKPDPAKTAAVRLIPIPEDKHGLQRFLGMTNYLAKFIPAYSEATAPLRELLRQDVDWCWLEHHTAAFTKLKELVASPPVLRYFDVHQPVVLSADASQHGLGAVCLQNDRPVAFASRALTETESRYAQIEKELLALVYACAKFHHYIYGRPVTVETDHQPLITILKKPLHTASARIQRMMLRLQRYNLNVIYKRGKELYVADALSRAHLPSTDQAEAMEEYEVMVVDALSSHRVEELRRDTLADPVCRRLSEVIAAGWPNTFKEVPRDLRPFYAMREELTTDSGLILRGQRFIIPHSLQRYYLKQLHQGHPGLEATKRRARETMFWPTIYSDIEKEVSRCAPCNALKPHQPKEPLWLHDIPDLPWSLTAADVFEWGGKEHLVLVDSYSGWFEIDQLPGTTSAALVAKLKRHFATHGVPQQLMTDNAAYFTSREFQEFARKWDFYHVTSSPLYPQSNGLAERAVRSAKQLLEKCARDGTDVDAALLSLRNMPRDGLPSSAQRLLSRRTRAFIPMTKAMYSPRVETQVKKTLTQVRQRGKAYYDKSARPLAPLQAGQTVRMQTQVGHDRLAMVLGTAPQPNSYQVKAGKATYVRNRRHLLQTPETYVSDSSAEDPPAVAAVPPPPSPQRDAVGPRVSQGQGPVTLTRSGRVSKPSSLYNDFAMDQLGDGGQ